MKNSIQKCTELGMTLVTGGEKEDKNVSIGHCRKAEGKLGRGRSTNQSRKQSHISEILYCVCMLPPTLDFGFLEAAMALESY